jgi:hypothetical protein
LLLNENSISFDNLFVKHIIKPITETKLKNDCLSIFSDSYTKKQQENFTFNISERIFKSFKDIARLHSKT